MSVELRWKVRVLTISSSVCSSVVVFCLELQCVHVCVEMLSTGGECCVEKSPLIRAGRHCIRLKCACKRACVRVCARMSAHVSFRVLFHGAVYVPLSCCTSCKMWRKGFRRSFLCHLHTVGIHKWSKWFHKLPEFGLLLIRIENTETLDRLLGILWRH